MVCWIIVGDERGSHGKDRQMELEISELKPVVIGIVAGIVVGFIAGFLVCFEVTGNLASNAADSTSPAKSTPLPLFSSVASLQVTNAELPGMQMQSPPGWMETQRGVPTNAPQTTRAGKAAEKRGD